MEAYKLNKYVPKIYDGILEMDELISSEQEIFDEAIDQANEVQDNAFIVTSNLDRIKQYEKLLKIKANPVTETTQFRRERILNRMSTKAPFTIKWLKEKLNVFIGEGNYSLTYTPDEYYVYIKVKQMTEQWDTELRELLYQTIPANIDWQLTENPYTTYGELKNLAYTHEDLSEYTFNEVRELI